MVNEVKLESVRKIAARILNCGESKVWMDPEQSSKAGEAITKEDVKELIRTGVIKKKRAQFQSRGRARILKAQKRKGRKKGHGKRKGTARARSNKKESWMKRVRSLRRKLAELKKEGSIKEGEYKKFYKLIKGNYFRGRKHLEEAVKGTVVQETKKGEI